MKLETLEVAGTARELGLAQGEALRERIRSFVAVRYNSVTGYFGDRGWKTIDGLLDAGRASMAIAAEWDPEGHAEHLGIAEAAGLDPVELFTATNMTDMRDVVLLPWRRGEEGCTSVLVPASHAVGGHALVGQNWDLNPPDVEYIVAIHRKPVAGPETWSVTCAGCLSLIGINDRGLSVGTTNIKCHGSRPGVGYLGLLHRALRSPDVAAASKVISEAPRAGAHTYWLADADEQVEWEASPVALERRDTSAGPIARTNHCIGAAHVACQGEATTLSSRARLDRAGALLGDGPIDRARLQAIFADRSDGVFSINRYPEDEQGTATNAVFIAEPAERRAWACRGPADRGEWIELGFG